MVTSRGKKIALRLGVLCLIAVVTAGIMLRGTMLESWYIHRLGHADRNVKKHAVERLGELRSARAALPLSRLYLEECIQSGEEWERELEELTSPEAFDDAQISDLLEVDVSPFETLYLEEAILAAFEKIGSRARLAIPILLDGFAKEAVAAFQGNPNVEARALARVAAEDIPQIIEALRHQHHNVRDVAAQALGIIGPPASAAVPLLIEISKDDDDEHFRNSVVWALGRVGPVAIPALIESLDANDGVENHGFFVAARALDSMGSEGREALISGLKRESLDRRAACAFAISWLIEPDSKGYEAAGPVLGDMIESGDIRIRRAATAALASFPASAANLVSRLSRLLDDRDESVRRSAARALGMAGASAEPAVSVLINLLEDEESIRQVTVKALGKIGPGAGPAVPKLLDLLRSGWTTDRYEAAKALGKIGVDSPAVISALETASKDKEESVRRHAREALERLREKP